MAAIARGGVSRETSRPHSACHLMPHPRGKPRRARVAQESSAQQPHTFTVEGDRRTPAFGSCDIGWGDVRVKVRPDSPVRGLRAPCSANDRLIQRIWPALFAAAVECPVNRGMPSAGATVAISSPALCRPRRG